MTPSLLERICRLPLDFMSGDKSCAQLVKESGYSVSSTALTMSELTKFLEAEPALMDAWTTWSADKRVSSGWYVAFTGGQWEVGCYPDGPVSHFANRASAVAEFISREIAAVAANSIAR